MEYLICINILLLASAGHCSLQLRCTPKPGCDFSNCEIPDHLKEIQGFNEEEYREQNEYHIICKTDPGEREEHEVNKEHRYECKPRENCDFSTCDPIPLHLKEIQGFDANLYRESVEYFIECDAKSRTEETEITNLRREMEKKDEAHDAAIKDLKNSVTDLQKQLQDVKDKIQTSSSSVRPTSRAATITSAGLCKFPKVQTSCASRCPPTCLEPNPRRCTRACNPNVVCVCPKHLVQISSTNNSCVELSNCPKFIRLVDGGSPNQGRVEIFYKAEWGTICDDKWDINDAHVVCGMLGFKKALKAPGQAKFKQGHGQIWLDDVECRGHEESITSCGHRKWGVTDCSHAEDASVICDPH